MTTRIADLLDIIHVYLFCITSIPEKCGMLVVEMIFEPACLFVPLSLSLSHIQECNRSPCDVTDGVVDVTNSGSRVYQSLSNGSRIIKK